MASQSRLPSRRLPGSGKARPMSMFVSSSSDSAKQKNDSGDGDSQEDESSGSRSTSRLSKRRSLLPQFSRKASVEEKEKMQAPPTEEEDEEDDSETKAASDRMAMPPPPKPSRPMSMIRAPGLGIPSRTTSLRSHTRKASKADDAAAADPVKAARPVSMIVKSDSGLKRAGSTRLPQSPPRRGVPVSQQAKPTHNRTRTSSSSAASVLTEKRPSVSGASIKGPALNTNSHARAPSQTSPTSSPTSTRPSSKSQLPASSTSSSSTTATTVPRPAFNTYQQHYSPSKSTAPKPPIPSSRSSKPPTTTATADEPESQLTSDLIREQLELLLLSLTHSAAEPTLQAFAHSAKTALARRHARLYKEFAGLRAREQAQRRQANLAALQTWCAEPRLLAEHLQTLGRVAGELARLAGGHSGGGNDDEGSGASSSSSSRYAEMCARFDDWMARAEPLLLDSSMEAATAAAGGMGGGGGGKAEEGSSGAVAAKPASTTGGGVSSGAVEGLPESFRATRTALALKLRALQHELSMLPPCPPPSASGASSSSLEILVRNCSSLADGMLKELELMTKLEKEVLSRERARVNEQVEGLLRAGSEQGGAAVQETWIPAWQQGVA